jgi:CheY-like chemotaxis protein
MTMPKRLLVADDSLTIQRVIELAFANENIDVVAASSGEDAIRQIDERPPAIVLADTRMPDRSGYEIAEFVSSIPSGDQIPVVLMSGAFEPVDDRRARAAGCETVLVKPFDPTVLVKTVHELLGHTAEPAAAGSVEAPSDAAELASGERAASMATPAGEADLVWPVKDDITGSPVVGAPAAGTGAVAVSAPASASSTAASEAAGPARTRAAASTLVVTDELVDRLATRVIARLSDRVVRDVTAKVVGEVAERLVAEEIERLKRKLR